MSEDAPVEVSLTQSKAQINKQIENETLHHKRHKKNAKKRKPKWAKSNKNKTLKEMTSSQFKDDDFKEKNNSNEPPIKKRRLTKWMQESDLFHHLNNDKNDNENTTDNNEIDDTQIQPIANENDSEINNEIDNEVPQEVIDLFEQAVKESKTEKELEDKWKKIIDEQSKKYANLKHKLSKFDKVFVNGFQLELNGVIRLNTSALNRALKMKHFSNKHQHRIKYNKKMCSGSTEPSFSFIENSINNKYDINEPIKPVSFWGRKIEHMEKVGKQDELDKWLDM